MDLILSIESCARDSGCLYPWSITDKHNRRRFRCLSSKLCAARTRIGSAEFNKDYVIAAKVAGVGPIRLMFKTVLPNCLAPLIVQAALGVSNAILEAAALGFLGLGAQPPVPEWGAMLADSREFIRSNPWIVTLPGLAILISVVAINLFGDGLRDALDPKLRRS